MGMTLPCVPFIRDGDMGATDKNVILTAVTDIINRPVSSLLDTISCRDLQNLIDFASKRIGVDSKVLVDNITIGDLLQLVKRSGSSNCLIYSMALARIFENMCKHDYSYEIVVISNLKAYLETLAEASTYANAAKTVTEFLSMAETFNEEADRISLYEYLLRLDRYAYRAWDIEEETLEEYGDAMQDLHEHYKKLFIEVPCMIIRTNMTEIKRKCARKDNVTRNH